MKLQNLGTVTFGALPFEGRVTFSNDSNNPLDSGFGYANAALGVFSRSSSRTRCSRGTTSITTRISTFRTTGR